MDSLIDCALQNAVRRREDLFGKGGKFVRFEAEDEDVGAAYWQSSLRFGRIVYNKPDGKTEYSPKLMLKVAPSILVMKDFSMLQFFNEALFYAKILPFYRSFDSQITRLFPECYNSVLQYNDGSDDAVIVFENLRPSGFSLPHKYAFLDYHHLRLMVRKLGEFHAYSYRAREAAPQKFYALARIPAETNVVILKQAPGSLLRCMSRGFEPLTTDPHYSSKIEKLRLLIDNCDEVFPNCLAGDEHNAAHVLCHGDFVRNNLLFAYENGKPTDLKMVDLATWRFASPITDLALLLYLNADQKMRDANWNNLIDEYYSAVCSTFPSTRVPSKDSILAEFNKNAIVAYFIASYFLPLMIEHDNTGDGSVKLPGEGEIVSWADMPEEVMLDFANKIGGMGATVALSNILKDMIDRGFVA